MLNTPIIEIPEEEATTPPIIKVIGVGGGGCNAVNYMYQQGISDVTFTVCNTDAQALRNSHVPTQLQLGEGLGAGTKVNVGKDLGEKHREEIKEHFSDGTRMVFVATGLGGGTGTGVAPIVASIARELGILTVGVVTLPFAYEGQQRIDAALDGLQAMQKEVDALIVINNERIINVYAELTHEEALHQVDEVLCVAVKSITEIITRSLHLNADFNDVRTTLENSGMAMINQIRMSGEGRLHKALTSIIDSPLLNNRNIYDAKRLLIVLRYPEGKEHTLRVAELNELKAFTKHFKTRNISGKHSFGNDPDLTDEICVTLLASGFADPMHTPSTEDDSLDEDQEARAQREARYTAYYGTPQQGIKAEPFVFKHLDDLDNASLIAQLDKQPAYKRTIMSNITLKQRYATADSKAMQQALSDRQPQPTTPEETITIDIDKGETYQLN